MKEKINFDSMFWLEFRKKAHEDIAGDLRQAIDGDAEMARALYCSSTLDSDTTTFEEFCEMMPNMLREQEAVLRVIANKIERGGVSDDASR